MVAGIAAVAAGGLLGGVAQNLSTLLVSRVLIGPGASCAYPSAMLLIRDRAREAGLDQPPGAVFGGIQITGVATASLGLPIGGLLVSALGRRAALHTHAPPEQLGTASGLLRTFGDVGSIASSAITGIVFRDRVDDHGIHVITWIMIGISLGVTVLTPADRTLRTRRAQPKP